MWDDSIKLFRRQNEGLKAWQKLAGQIVGAVIFMVVYVHERLPLAVHIPGMGDLHLGFLYILFVIIWLVGFSNAVNLTDGLDGLVSGLATIAFGAYGFLAWHQHQFDIMIFFVWQLSAVWLGFSFITISQLKFSWATWARLP